MNMEKPGTLAPDTEILQPAQVSGPYVEHSRLRARSRTPLNFRASSLSVEFNASVSNCGAPADQSVANHFQHMSLPAALGFNWH